LIVKENSLTPQLEKIEIEENAENWVAIKNEIVEEWQSHHSD